MGFAPGKLSNSAAYIAAAVCFVVFALTDLVAPPQDTPFGGSAWPSAFEAKDVKIYWLGCLFILHYSRRVIEVLVVASYVRSRDISEIFAPLHYGLFSAWIGWAINDQDLPPLSMVVLGSIVFFIGELGNALAHRQLAALRITGQAKLKAQQEEQSDDVVGVDLSGAVKDDSNNGVINSTDDEKHTQLVAKGDVVEEDTRTATTAAAIAKQNDNKLAKASHHLIPRGRLFEYVSCPHYLCESISWFGFFLASMTMASGAFFLVSVFVMLDRAIKAHAKYGTEFDGIDGRELYPSNRKAMIPFII